MRNSFDPMARILRRSIFLGARQSCALGITVAACLNAGIASALDFNFSFSGDGSPASPSTVTGIITGLLDNTSNQTNGITITITSATNTPSGGWAVFNPSNYVTGAGVDVSGGLITNIQYGAASSTQYVSLTFGGSVLSEPIIRAC